MELTQHRCRNCGGILLPFGEGKLRCQNCGGIFEVASAEKHTKQMQELFDDAKQEIINNLRQNLYNATRAEYVSSTEVHDICVSLKQYLPNDFQANFYDIASGSNARAITDAIRKIDVEKNYEDLDGVLSYLIRSLQTDYLLELNNLVERAYRRRDLEKFEYYSTAISEEAEKVQLGIYETKLPREVFVAYSSKDMDKVSELVRVLESQNLSCFVAARNLRHGKGAVENYNRALEEAMEHCKTFVFVSSCNSRSISCDALEIEIPYIQKLDLRNTPPEYRNNYATIPHRYKKPRVEYRIEDSATKNAADAMVEEFFDGYEHAYSPNEVARRILKQRLQASNPDYDTPAPQSFAHTAKAKYCAKCGQENSIDTKFCSQCGNSTFLNSVADFIKDKERAEAEAARKLKEAQLEAQRQKEAAERAEERAKRTNTTTTYSSPYEITSDKNPWVALFLCLILGTFGAHRFYAGKKGSAVFYLCTCGGFGIGILVDAIRILTGHFKDEFGDPIKFEGKKKSAGRIIGIIFAIYMSLVIVVMIIAVVVGIGQEIFSGSPDDPSQESGGGIAQDIGDTVEYDYITYTMSAGGWSVSVSEEDRGSLSGDLAIPSEIDGCEVIEIAEGGFLNCSALTSVTVPDTIQSIGEGAFKGCNNLKSITLPFVGKSRTAQNSEAVFGYIFGNDEYAGGVATEQHYNSGTYNYTNYYIPGQLTSVSITDITQLPYGAFHHCKMLKTIDMPDNLVGAGVGAFNGCSGITEISLPNIASISDYMFSGCSSLTSFELGESVTSIGEYSFQNCASLSQISSATEGEFIIGDNVQTIGKNAFSGCIKMKSLTIPFVGNSRTAQGSEGVFGYIFGTTEYSGGLATEQHYNSGTYNYTTYYIPGQLSSVSVTDTTQLPYGAFHNCKMLKNIDVTEKVISVGVGVFNGCSGITEISLPNITAISDYLFSGCSSLEHFEIGESVTSIGELAFSGCISLARIDSDFAGEFVIQKSITDIGKSAFRGCLKMQSLTIPFVGLTSTSSGSEGVFGIIFGTSEYTGGTATEQHYNSGTYNYTNYYIPGQLRKVTVTNATMLSYGAFYNCSMLTEININATAQSNVHSTAFTGCTATPNYFEGGWSNIGELN